MAEKIPLILDCDPGIDDAVAMAICLFSPQIDLRLISTVAGNVSLDKSSRNALKLKNFLGVSVPVARGAITPLVVPFVPASVHGISGLDGWEFPEPDPGEFLPEHAVLAMARVLRESSEKMTLLSIGPQTNLALLFRMFPECKSKIERLVIMGGSRGRGNKTLMGEFNIATDPEAAKIVAEAGLPLILADLDIGCQANLDRETCEKMRDQNRTGGMLYALFSCYRDGDFSRGVNIYDATAAAWILKPELFRYQDCHLEVETQGLCQGVTVLDLENRSGLPANCRFLTEVDQAAYRKWFLEVLRLCP